MDNKSSGPQNLVFVLVKTLRGAGMVLALFINVALIAQQALPPEIKAELRRRSVTEDEVRERLISRGINADDLTQEQLIILAPEIESIVAELEAEKAGGIGADPKQGDEAMRGRSTTGNTLRREPGSTQELQTGIGPSVASPASDTSRNRAPSKTPNIDGTAIGTTETRQRTPIYGHQIFENGALAVYQNVDAAQVPSSYRLGEGDEIAVNIFGTSQIDFLFEIDQSGFINPAGLAKIYVRGLTVAEARKLVSARLNQYYVFAPGQFALNVSGTRTLSVNVFGEVNRSGTYSLTAINGALNALYAAGGPTQQGSVRRIQVNRGSETIGIDIYRYLNAPASVTEVLTLRNNDIVFVPIARKIVELEGAVRRPLRYELLEAEGLSQLIEYAGGLSAAAAPATVQIVRLIEGISTVIDVAYRPDESTFVELKDGDVVRIRSVGNPARQSVLVRGAVVIDGEFAFAEGMRLAELLRDARLRPNARTDVAFLRRVNTDSTITLQQLVLEDALTDSTSTANIALQSGDVVEVLAQNLYADNSTISVTGAVRRPLEQYVYSRDSTLTINDAILLAGGLTPNAASEGILFRRDARNAKVTRYKLVQMDNGGEVVRMNPFDSLLVFPKELFTNTFPVEIAGAVRRPGTYRYDPSLGLRELFTLAGGLTLEAATNRIELFRLVFGNNTQTRTHIGQIAIDDEFNPTGEGVSISELQPFDIVVVRSVPNFEYTRLVEIRGEVKYPGVYPLNDDIRRVADVIRMAGGITSEAFPEGATLRRRELEVGLVVLELQDILRNAESPNNIVLLNNDMIEIPKARELVKIVTEGTRAKEAYVDSVTNRGVVNVAFSGPYSGKWYVKNYAGGFAERADKTSLVVREPSGRLRATKSFLGIRSYPKVKPGSAISLKLKPPKKEKPTRERVDWATIAAAITSALTAGITILLIARNLR